MKAHPSNQERMTARDILQKYWGYTDFRPGQEAIIQHVLSGHDTLAILPTGGGKSICFQVPAMAMEGLCLVVTPLVALMEDQLAQLRKKNIPAVSLHAGLSWSERRDLLSACVQGVNKFLYLSPERLETNEFLEALPWLPISLIAVDEAHCISQWGHDFRPSYLRIASVRKSARHAPVLALTASATEKVQDEIAEKLRLSQPKIFRQSFERPNLSYQLVEISSRASSLVEMLKKSTGASIVYCKTRRSTVEYTGVLKRAGLEADFYHAGLDRELRSSKQEAWVQNRCRIIVCTNAFGMGIDKPDVRLVIHTETPDCLENYYQEAGRAGRDGKPSQAILMYRNGDDAILESLPEQKFPPLSDIRKVYQALANYLQLPSGVGEDRIYPVDIREMADRFSLSLQQILYAVQAMQQAGIIDFQEQFFKPSTVQFVTGREELFALEEMHPDLTSLVRMLLRSYSGIFEHPVPISEKQLAKNLHVDISIIASGLLQLRGMGYIEYQPVTEKPQVRFLQDRVRAEDLYIDMAAYQARKKNYTERIQAMTGYLRTQDCRSVYIGRYFGDAHMKSCNTCDRCLSRNKKNLDKQMYQEVRDRILEILKEGPVDAHMLSRYFSENQESFWQVMDRLREQGSVKLDPEGRLEWVK